MKKDNGCDDIDLLIFARGAFDGVTLATWSPVTRIDIAGNFENFLFNKNGILVKRYYETAEIKEDTQKSQPQYYWLLPTQSLMKSLATF